jgi:hypothetical protein
MGNPQPSPNQSIHVLCMGAVQRLNGGGWVPLSPHVRLSKGAHGLCGNTCLRYSPTLTRKVRDYGMSYGERLHTVNNWEPAAYL